MEFTVSRNALLRALNHARCAIDAKASSIILKNFVFTFPDDQKPDTMTVHTGDGEQWISETIQIESQASSVDAPRPFCPFGVYYSDLIRPVKSLDEQPLLFRVGEYQISVHHSCGMFRIPLSGTAGEFFYITNKPQPDVDADDGHQIRYEVPGLRSIMNRCRFAMAKDELRPVMNGLYMNLTEDFSDYVSSDGYILVRVRKSPVCINGVPVCMSVIIPSKIVSTLMRILPSTGDITFDYQEELLGERERLVKGKYEKYQVIERPAAARITIDGNLTLSFPTVSGKYPRYWTVIPERFEFDMQVERRALIKSIDRLDLFANDSSRMVIMNMSENNLHLTAEDKDFEISGEENLTCEFKRKEGSGCAALRIGVKAPYLAATLKVLSSEEVIFHFRNDNGAFIITPKPQPDVEDVTMMLMPMIICD